ncbi:DUF6146 family protein [Gangjinia marincola]|uniref:DUF6146 family protein n=1 Tax=Gangjinia marincola TaxID=578463 RepID=A0ABN1MD58_9FLAO
MVKNILVILLIALGIYACATPKSNGTTTPSQADIENDTVRIANDSLEYEIIIIEPGFNLFLNSIARPEGYYSQQFLENRNRFLVTEYNQRVLNPQRWNPNLYMMQIDYDPSIDYGYEVNYKLYNYFVFFTRQFNQRFSVPTRI